MKKGCVQESKEQHMAYANQQITGNIIFKIIWIFAGVETHWKEVNYDSAWAGNNVIKLTPKRRRKRNWRNYSPEEVMTWFGVKLLQFLKATPDQDKISIMKIPSKIIITMNDSVTISLNKSLKDAQKNSNAFFANEAK